MSGKYDIKMCGTSDKSLSYNEYHKLRNSVGKGNIIRLKRGVYCNKEDISIASLDIEKIVPGGVMCMWSAWNYYGLCSKEPEAVCIAVATHRTIKAPEFPKYKIYHWTEKSLTIGVKTETSNGVSFKICDSHQPDGSEEPAAWLGRKT